ncbi:hematopoietic SH2 domain-containing protein isoform X2 [Loxodonta africana]|uniref:hematopoietic SH2 domain-containing protein isoform X2 n=1 Tax=Loxodonta africana TaxID=9785 RepID=UPI000C810B55|nr:hematopoietic SH2 domain-containing protein isoform X2 [Loxodonta africana]
MMEIRNLPPPLPPRLDWFVHTQAGELAQGGIPEWFHGAISREAAENLLEPQPPGSFLIRVSHSHVGYTLSYKAHGCCRHFMVKLLDDGSVVIPGENAAHASLDALVTFYQQEPMRPYGELLTQPCGQEDLANVDYEDLFLYSNTLGEEAASPTHDPRRHQGLSPCQAATPEETVSSGKTENPSGLFTTASPAPPRGSDTSKASLKPVLLRWPKERKPSAEMDRASLESTASSCPTKAPFGVTRQKLWKSLKTLPQTGKRVQQQLKSHLAAVSLPLLSDTRWSTTTHSSGARASSHEDAGATNWEDDAYTDSFEGSQAPCEPPRDRNALSREALRSVSWSRVSPGDRGLHQAVARSQSQQVSKQDTRGLVEPQDWLPEEYLPPPPFAPGYC